MKKKCEKIEERRLGTEVRGMNGREEEEEEEE